MTIDVEPVPFERIEPLRALHRQAMRCQVVGDSLPGRGFGDLFLLLVDARVAGYGFVMGYRGEPRDIVREFFLLPPFRAFAVPLFRKLIEVSSACTVLAQTNDTLLTLMLLDFTTGLTSDTILFADAVTTHLVAPSVRFRRTITAENETIFGHLSEPVGDWVIETEGEIVATGGIMTHYNPPYGDIFMEVAAPFRRQGLGSFLVQELKRVAYESGLIPAARCDVINTASRATLERVGLLPCARMVRGVLDASRLVGIPT
jgi:GNAT superfamily N-acetyltransferase